MNSGPAFKSTLIALVLPMCGYAQPVEIRKQVDTHLIYDGKAPKSLYDSMSKEELIRAFNEDKVTVGTTAMRVAGFTISWLPPGSDLVGPYSVDVYFGIDGYGVDTTAPNRRIANFLTRILSVAHKGEKVFIDAIYATNAAGELCKIKQATAFILK